MVERIRQPNSSSGVSYQLSVDSSLGLKQDTLTIIAVSFERELNLQNINSAFEFYILFPTCVGKILEYAAIGIAR